MTCYSESPLVKTSVDLSEKSNARTHKKYNPEGRITKITVHHMAGIMTAEACAKMHQNSDRKASANYYIGKAGEIVAGVPESRRAWTSSSAANDYNAITIEVSNDCKGEPWSVSDASWRSLIALCTDICVRNDIKVMRYTGDKDGSLTTHNMFAKTACPGTYLLGKMRELAQLINENICATEPEHLPDDGEYYTVQRGDTVTKICFMYDITFKRIQELNNLPNLNKIFVGQRLRVR